MSVEIGIANTVMASVCLGMGLAEWAIKDHISKGMVFFVVGNAAFAFWNLRELFA